MRNVLIASAVLCLCFGSNEAFARGLNLGPLLRKFANRTNETTKFLEGIGKAAESVDKTKDIITKYVPDWKRDLRAQRGEVADLTTSIKDLALPDDVEQLEALVTDLSSLHDLVSEERAALLEKSADVRSKVDRCLAEKKSLFECSEIFQQIELAQYGDKLRALDSALEAKHRVAVAKLRKVKK